MKTLYSLVLSLCLFAGFAGAQTNTLTMTTNSVAILATDATVTVTSATNINAPNPGTGVIGSQLYVIAPGQPRGETMIVRSVTGTTIGVRRGASGIRSGFPSGSTVLVGQPNWFYNYDPNGSCVAASTYVTPWVNTATGLQWACSTVTLTWVPGFQNETTAAQPMAAVASAAGLITPTGKLMHITGTAAITGFTLPVGFVGDTVCAIPDGIFTTTNANNIALASTAVVNKQLCWRYDWNSAKFYPSY